MVQSGNPLGRQGVESLRRGGGGVHPCPRYPPPKSAVVKYIQILYLLYKVSMQDLGI